MRAIQTQVTEEHPDYLFLSALRDEIVTRAGGIEELTARFPKIVRDAIDFVLDSVRTAQTRLCELDNVEKTFIGLKLEHFIRDLVDMPKGLRDLEINGIDVDIKNTVGGNWSIPQETYRNSEPCLLDGDRRSEAPVFPRSDNSQARISARRLGEPGYEEGRIRRRIRQYPMDGEGSSIPAEPFQLAQHGPLSETPEDTQGK